MMENKNLIISYYGIENLAEEESKFYSKAFKVGDRITLQDNYPTKIIKIREIYPIKEIQGHFKFYLANTITDGSMGTFRIINHFFFHIESNE